MAAESTGSKTSGTKPKPKPKPKPKAPAPKAPPAPPAPEPLSAEEERSWAMLAHLSMLLNLVTVVFGPVAALIIYLVYKERSRYVAYQALQSLLFQLIAWVGAGVLVTLSWTVTGVLLAFVCGLACIPGAGIVTLLPLAGIVYSIIGAVECNKGNDFRYPLIGDWVRSTLTG